MENKVKEFDLGAILNITTGRLFTNMDDIFDVLNFLTGEDLYIHQFPRVMKYAKPYVLSLYPNLQGVGLDVEIKTIEDAKKYIDEQKKIFGDKLTLTPMPDTVGYTPVGPIQEIIDIQTKKR